MEPPAAAAAAAHDAATSAAALAKKGYTLTPTLVHPAADPQTSSSSSSPHHPLRVLNGDAIWTLSSARAGCAIDELLSDDPDTYWQTDGLTPHTVAIQFYKREAVSEVALLVDFSRDESYTPQAFVIKSGALSTDLEAVRLVTLTEAAPKGWVRVPLGGSGGADGPCHRTSYLSIVVTHMYANGRDMHIRGIRVLGPRAGGHRSGISALGGTVPPVAGGALGGGAASFDPGPDEWVTPEMTACSRLR